MLDSWENEGGVVVNDELGRNEVLLGRRRARVGVRHVGLELSLWNDQTERRATIATVRVGNSLIAEGVALCNPKDQFSRKVGRKLAGLRVLELLKAQGYSPEDRGAVFDKICDSRCKATRVPRQ